MKYVTDCTIHTVRRVIAGINAVEKFSTAAKEHNTDRALIVTDSGVWNAGLVEKPLNILKYAGIHVDVINNIPPEPELKQIIQAFDRVKTENYGILAGIGGGSVMDATKLKDRMASL